ELRGMLRLRQAEARDRMAAEAERLSRVEARLRQIETEGRVGEYDVVVKPLEAQHVALVDTTATPFGNATLGPIFGQLFGELSGVPADVFDGLPADPVGLCRAVPGLIVHEMWASTYGFDVPESRLSDLQARSAVEMTEVIRRLDPGPLSAARPVEQRMVGNCRHFSTLSCALLRRAGIQARARCGFGMYLEHGKYVDAWVT